VEAVVRKQHRTRLLLVILPLTLLFAPGHPTAARLAEEFKAETSKATLSRLNVASRAAYRNSREEALARTGPVVLVEGDNLVLRYGVFRQSARCVPEVYHTLKAIGHIPLAIHALLVHHTDKPLDDPRLFDLKRYKDQVTAASPALDACGLEKELLARQKQIVRISLDFLEAVLKHKRVEGKELLAFTRRVRPQIDAGVAGAARAQIDATHKQMTAWRNKLTEEEWKKLKVIVMGLQMPRRDNISVQYFARLLGVPGEGPRIIYSEAIFDEERALALLGTHLVDTRIGADFFGDPKRMHRDLLGDAAKVYLDELFKKSEP
jgi:hypothetical protein